MITLRTDLPVPAGAEVTVPADRTGFVAVDDDGRPVGVVVARVEDGVGAVSRIWADPAAGEPGVLERLMLAAATAHLRTVGASSVTVQVTHSQTALTAALQDAPVLGIFMTRPVSSPSPELPPGYGHRPMTPTEFAAWYEDRLLTYARDGLDRAGGDEALALQGARDDFALYLPDGLTTADTTLLVLTHEGEQVGELWLRHHWGEAADQTFGFDLEIRPERRGEGMGRAALAAADQLAAAAGDHELGLHVFGQNTVAQNLYRSDGFVTRATTYGA